MGQENFAGPEYFTEFDPEKFLRDIKQMAEMDEENGGEGKHIPEQPAQSPETPEDHA